MAFQSVYVCLTLLLSTLISSQLLQNCRLIRSTSDLPVLIKEGDIMIGALFSLHDTVLESPSSFTAEPHPTQCSGFNFRTFRWMQTMIFAIEEINRDRQLLANLTMGYTIYDSCSTHFHALRTALALMNGNKEGTGISECRGRVPVVIGDGGSTLSLVVARFLGVFHVPQVSYFSSCACLSNKLEFPAFLRTMPSDFFQVDALAQLVRHFGWSWVGTFAGDDAYGRGGAQIFNDEVTKLGACIAFYEIIPKNHEQTEISRIVQRIRESGTSVVLVFALEQDARALFLEALRQNLTDIQWLASEAWITAAVLSTPEFHSILQGSMGYAIRRADIPGLEPFLQRLHPSKYPQDPFVLQFWEEMFKCSLGTSNKGSSYRPPCNGSEILAKTGNIYSDVSQLRISYNVYKAVYAIAHALDSMLRCEPGKGPFPGGLCPNTSSVQPWQLLNYLKHVHFTNDFGEETKFDANGDPVAMYDLINWQLSGNGEVWYATVGRFDETMQPKLVIEEKNIIWNGNQKQVPMSVCSNSCPPGTRKATRPNFPLCCFDCIVCAAGEVSNQTDALECEKCLPEFWSNTRRDTCVPKLVDFLSYSDTMGITLLAVALLGSCFTLAVALIFTLKRHTPLVRANNSELSFLILSSLWLCFLCALAFIGQPTSWSCGLRHTAFGIAFSLCLSCILGKTMVVLMAFRATLPGSNVMKWFGPLQQRGIIFLCTAVQVVICCTWLSVAPPVPRKLMTRETARIILLCDVGSPLAFSLVLGYIGLLAAVCFVLAFFARKLPDNFNEAKFITFSMLIFCAVWIAFVPAYVSSPGKYTVAVEIFAILASSYGLLLCIFTPKCYIILLKPEKNTKRYLMSKSNSERKY
ncbi:extracellular calcium-sensing receptor-like [Sinocyclocheilus grahami]|uniref:extracellular calcium-sensing receptor-like n=1 Tax=Sinocyclocheilus grahami TaxID=75366 RepID=UPI0007AC9BCB|nr:PREDICTED: extracellular calcium-sensing receptor-like [Sinocyclocheilus grahami]